MAITFGFYNSMNGDRKYDAVQISSIFDGVIRDGVFQSIGGYLATKPGTGMRVIVSPGKAWFNHTWTINDAALPLDIEQADVTLKRYDAIILEVDSTKTVRENTIKVVKGTPASDPKKPQLTNTDDVHQYALAYILVNPGVTEIKSQDIEVNVGKDDCPFVTSILESVSIEALLEKWEGEFRVWFDDLQDQMSGDVATNLQNQITRNAPSVGDIMISFDSDKTGPWLKCNGQSYDKGLYSELYQKLKKSCSFERPIPIIPGFDSVIFVGDKGFFYKDKTVYVSDSIWSAPVKEHSFMPEEVFSQYSAISSSVYGAEFFYVNGRYFMVVPGTWPIDSKNEMIYAYSDNGYEWTPKKIHYSDGTVKCNLIAIVYHRSMYALIFRDPSKLYVAYLNNLDSESFSERTEIGFCGTSTLGVYVTKNGETIYIMEQLENNYSNNWKIDRTGAVKSFTINDTKDHMDWAQVYEVSGKIRRIRSTFYAENFELNLDEEGTESYLSQIRPSWPEGIKSRGLDIIVEDGTPYIFVGKNVFTIEGSSFKLIRDDFPYYVGVSERGKYNNNTVRINLNSHFLIGSITENRIASSYYKYATTAGLLVEDSGVRTNSPEITPYIELDQGIAYIRSEK